MTFSTMTWLNPPSAATEGAEGLTVTTAPNTDFWVETFYGFTRHSGHHLSHPVTGDFTARVTVTADYQALYDQAGLMLRLSDRHWIKAGIEHTDGQPVFSTVVTNGQSDWATLPLSFPASPITLRLTRHGSAVRVDVQEPSGLWRMTRLAHLPDGPAFIGPMACSPERGGFTATFSNYTCGAAIPRALHEDHP
jgi:regulation of enolase protein 1 (concanavalin A-like superfamily)